MSNPQNEKRTVTLSNAAWTGSGILAAITAFIDPPMQGVVGIGAFILFGIAVANL